LTQVKSHFDRPIYYFIVAFPAIHRFDNDIADPWPSHVDAVYHHEISDPV
jgi:hypothetical protein